MKDEVERKMKEEERVFRCEENRRRKCFGVSLTEGKFDIMKTYNGQKSNFIGQTKMAFKPKSKKLGSTNLLLLAFFKHNLTFF